MRKILTKPNMPDPRKLSDDELLLESLEWRRRAMVGEQGSREFALRLEREVRRRFAPGVQGLTSGFQELLTVGSLRHSKLLVLRLVRGLKRRLT